MRSLSEFEKVLYGPCLVMAFSIRKALSWLKSIHMNNAIIESDYLTVVNALLNLSSDASRVGMLVHDC